jgi:hypothetical protein
METEPLLEELRAMATEAPRYRRVEPQTQRKEEETDTVTGETDIDLEQRSTEKNTERA